MHHHHSVSTSPLPFLPTVYLVIATFLLGYFFVGFVPAFPGIIWNIGRFVLGTRSRTEGIICVNCARRAFPVYRTTTRYRCCQCNTLFDGPDHFE